MICLFRCETTASAGHVTRFAYFSNERDGDLPACAGSKPSLQVINKKLAYTLIPCVGNRYTNQTISKSIYIFVLLYKYYICMYTCLLISYKS